MVSITSWNRLFLACLTAAVATRAALPSAEEFSANSAQGLRLIELDEAADPVWMTEEQRLDLINDDTNFFDITETYDPPADAGIARIAGGPRPGKGHGHGSDELYARPSQQRSVRQFFRDISLRQMQSYLASLTAFHNRYYTSETGVAASLWIRDTAAKIASQPRGKRSRATVSLVSHKFPQSSIVARFPGRNESGPVTIIGAHMDSINGRNVTGRAPGADDDGSGSTNLLEAFRVLVRGGFRPETPVELHWYAGEEEGLLGSQDIAKSYAENGIVVKGMMQLDMTAYVKPGSVGTVSLVPDFTNSNLTTYIGSIVDEYLDIPWAISPPCGYACSDHGSWTRNGYPAAFPFEAPFGTHHNRLIHTTNDTIKVDGFSWSHTFEYTKLAIAYAVELSS